MLKNIKTADNWEELIRSDLNGYSLSLCVHSIKYSNRNIGGSRYKKLIVYVKNNIGYYYENFNDHFRIGKNLIKLFSRDKRELEKYAVLWGKDFLELNRVFQKIRKTNLNKLTNNELADLLEELYLKFIFWLGMAYNVDAVDATLNPLLERLLKKAYMETKKSELGSIYNKITFPDELSYANRMHIEKLSLFQKIKLTGLESQEIKIKKFVAKYYWINFGLGESKEYTERKFIGEYKDYISEAEQEDPKEAKKRFRKTFLEKQKIIEYISKKLPLIKSYIKIFDIYAIFHDLRKEGQVKGFYFSRKIYDEISRRFGIDKDLTYFYFIPELIKVARKEASVDASLLKKRSDEWYFEYYNSGKLTEIFGQEALKKRDHAVKFNMRELQKELSGVAASPGRVIGIAKVCLSVKEAIKNITENDILITGMTMPEFMPAMKKALAVITDEGGLTCHAAIICRELGKPCVVGTKMATRLIKNGDKIEVNANHGIIKIIN